MFGERFSDRIGRAEVRPGVVHEAALSRNILGNLVVTAWERVNTHWCARDRRHEAVFQPTEDLTALVDGCREAGDLRPLLDYLLERCKWPTYTLAVELAISSLPAND